MKKPTKHSTVKKKQSWMINISDEGKLLIDPRDGEIVFVKGDCHWYRHNGFINLERLSFEFNLDFDFTQFIESGPEEDDPYWFCADEAREVLMKIFAKLSVNAREALFEGCR